MLSFFNAFRKFYLLAVMGFIVAFTNPITVSAAPSLLDELAERIEGSPLQIFSILSDSLERGVVSVDADWGEDTNFALSLYSNQQNQDYGLSVAVNDNWVNFDVDIFANRDRAAARASAASNNFFGIQFDTFADDLQTLIMGMYELEMIPFIPSEAEINEFMGDLLGYINEIETFMNMNTIDIEDYMDILLEALLQIEHTSERVVIRSAGRSVATDRTSFAIDIDALFSLLINLIDRTEELAGLEVSNQIFAELRQEILETKENVEGVITVAVYTERTGRLRRISLHIESIEHMHSTAHEENVSFTIDLGRSATDTWSFEMNNYSFGETIQATWEIEETEYNIIHTFTSTQKPTWSDLVNVYIFAIDWNRSTNYLVLSYKEDTFWRAAETYDITLYLTMDNTSFTLQISEYDINATISAKSGVPVPDIDFINLDRWIYHLPELEAILDLFGL